MLKNVVSPTFKDVRYFTITLNSEGLYEPPYRIPVDTVNSLVNW